MDAPLKNYFACMTLLEYCALFLSFQQAKDFSSGQKTICFGEMERKIQTVLTVICGVALVGSWTGIHPWLPYLAVIAGSWFALKSAWQAIAERRLDVNLLMVVAAIGSIAVGHAVEAAVLLFLFSLSNTLEVYAMGRTKSAIESLVKLRPETALLIEDGEDREVLLSELRPNDLIRVRAFQQIPIDGVIEQGSTSINEAAMTGEAAPVSRSQGQNVLAGTQNLDGMIVVRATATAGDTTLDKIVDLVRDAQENKASGERISQWFGQKYTFFVLGAFGLSLLLRWQLAGEPFESNLYSSLTLLVALSPCAIVISSPAASLSALAWAARNGILVRGGQHVEMAGKIDAICMDKTGTLTTGVPRLAEICVCSTESACREEEACWHLGGEMSKEALDVLQAAAGAEQYSTHPLAGAIVSAAKEAGLEIPEAHNHVVHPGLGVEAEVGGERILIGQRRFFEQTNPLDPFFAAHVEEIQRKGMTVAILQCRGIMAALGLRDAPRGNAADVVRILRELGIRRLTMLTGDTQQTAEAVAEEVGITDIRAGLMPADKERIIGESEDSGARTMMIGDGINDAPSLARASLGVAMGGLGSDVAMNAADVVLMQDRLERVSQFVMLGRKANSIIRANLFFAGGVIAILTLGSVILSFTAPQWHRFILPFAVVGHEGSTVLVILNGLRLLRGPGRI